MPKVSPKTKAFKASQAAEAEFAKALRKIGRTSGHIVEAHVDGDRIKNSAEMEAALKAYSKLIDPWARRQAAKMLEKVQKANQRAYAKNSKIMGRLMQTTVAEGQVGETAAMLMQEQVELIKSIPVRAAERAQKLSLEAAFQGKRASEVAEELMRSTQVSESDAIRIARTEVARSNAYINMTRSQAVGATHYKWRNSHDAAVREAHKRYNGKQLDGMVFSWNDPPTLDDGTTGHPGTFPNCRCYAEPIFDEDIK
jgi:SPP1 gp7 family putative phage head morphogenesis protein